MVESVRAQTVLIIRYKILKKNFFLNFTTLLHNLNAVKMHLLLHKNYSKRFAILMCAKKDLFHFAFKHRKVRIQYVKFPVPKGMCMFMIPREI
jgi:hypothetical protein